MASDEKRGEGYAGSRWPAAAVEQPAEHRLVDVQLALRGRRGAADLVAHHGVAAPLPKAAEGMLLGVGLLQSVAG